MGLIKTEVEGLFARLGCSPVAGEDETEEAQLLHDALNAALNLSGCEGPSRPVRVDAALLGWMLPY
eukprot:1729410-Prymnesium_polylepis.1